MFRSRSNNFHTLIIYTSVQSTGCRMNTISVYNLKFYWTTDENSRKCTILMDKTPQFSGKQHTSWLPVGRGQPSPHLILPMPLSSWSFHHANLRNVILAMCLQTKQGTYNNFLPKQKRLQLMVVEFGQIVHLAEIAEVLQLNAVHFTRYKFLLERQNVKLTIILNTTGHIIRAQPNL